MASSSGDSALNSPISYAVDAVKTTVVGAVEAPLSLTKGAGRLLLLRGLRSHISDSRDIWTEEESTEKPRLQRLLDEIIRRIDENEAEERSPKLLGMRERNLDPSRWPPPPVFGSNPLAWLRARVLYAFCPADRDLAYARKHERWMLLVLIPLLLPGIGSAAWVMLLLLLLFTVHDPYQLLRGIWTFKTYAFVCWGVLPVLIDHVNLYFIDGASL